MLVMQMKNLIPMVDMMTVSRINTLRGSSPHRLTATCLLDKLQVTTTWVKSRTTQNTTALISRFHSSTTATGLYVAKNQVGFTGIGKNKIVFHR